MTLTPQDLVVGDRYKWKDQLPKLVYLGKIQDHRFCRGWYQFAKIENPEKVWCEIREEDLSMMEKTT